jgi:PAS domain S-box-containing protein
MDESIIIELLQNVAILLAFAMLYENFWLQKSESLTFVGKLFAGTVIGGIGVVLMFTPWTFVPGIVFDTRSVMLSVSGLFFGPLPTITAMIIDSVVRFIMGGDGVWMGVFVIFSSGLVGLAWRDFRFHKRLTNKPLEFLGMGIVVHLLMLVATFLLPDGQIMETLGTVVLPVILIYIPGNMLLGMLLAAQQRNFQNRIAKDKLSQTEHQLSQILRSNNIISLIFDKDLNVSFCNQYLLDLTGFSQDELNRDIWGKMFQNIPGRKEFIRNGKEAMLSEDPNGGMEIPISSKDGSVFIISLYCARFHNSENNFTGAACIGVNITDQIRYENQLHKQIEKFTTLNNEYIAQNKELKSAKDKAEESDRLKSAFLANLSHEIRTPLNAILGFTDLLRMENLENEKREYFAEIIKDSGQYLLAIITDIIEISHIEAGQVNVSKSEINLKVFCSNIYHSFKLNVPKDSRVELRLDLPAKNGLGILKTDEEKLQQVIQVFLNNALKFTDEGSVILGYRIHKNQIRIFVKDTGIGIDQKFHSIIFERFRQVETEKSKMRGGSGLGLAISKAYVEMLGGSITVESEPGKGSVFSCNFPLNAD